MTNVDSVVHLNSDATVVISNDNVDKYASSPTIQNTTTEVYFQFSDAKQLSNHNTVDSVATFLVAHVPKINATFLTADYMPTKSSAEEENNDWK